MKMFANCQKVVEWRMFEKVCSKVVKRSESESSRNTTKVVATVSLDRNFTKKKAKGLTPELHLHPIDSRTQGDQPLTDTGNFADCGQRDASAERDIWKSAGWERDIWISPRKISLKLVIVLGNRSTAQQKFLKSEQIATRTMAWKLALFASSSIY